MNKKDDALKLAQDLRTLTDRFSEGWHEGIKIDASDIMLLNDAAQALAEQPAQQALNKMAQNARDIGLDYEPSSGTQVSKVWRDGGKLVAKQVPLEDFYKPAQQEPVNKYCCHLCFNKSGQVFLDRMILCPECGNKRCPKATHHDLPCTKSNDLGQKGSIYDQPAQRTWVGLTEEDENKLLETVIGSLPIAKNLIRAIEAKLRSKNEDRN